jgi:CubicO group peptidase (beta-lactamase class C family)
LINLTRRSHLIGLGAGALSACASPAKPQASGYIGTWSGVLDDGTMKVRVRLYIESESRARIVVIDQGAAEFETTAVKLAPDGISIEFINLDTMTGSLTGPDTLRLASSAWSITVDFARGDLWPPVMLTRDSLAEARRASGSPAMGLAYAKATGPVTILVDGLRSVDDNVPVAADDRWLLASVSKSMTATLVARLIEAGGITWDTTVADLLSDTAPGMLDVYKRVTFRHLLSSHAGLQPNIDISDFMTFSRDVLEDPREERLRYATFALKQQPTSTPGEAMLYANNGYVVTGAMLEARYGQPWEKLIDQHVFRPLGISSFGFGPPGTPGQIDQPLGHTLRRDTGEYIPGRPGSGAVIDNPYAMGPTGRIHMNLGDLITYLRAHLQRPENFLARASWTTLHTPPFTPGYAMGWFTDGNTLRHSGALPRWQTIAGVDFARGVVAAAAANTGAPKAASAVSELMLDGMHTAAS